MYNICRHDKGMYMHFLLTCTFWFLWPTNWQVHANNYETIMIAEYTIVSFSKLQGIVLLIRAMPNITDIQLSPAIYRKPQGYFTQSDG